MQIFSSFVLYNMYVVKKIIILSGKQYSGKDTAAKIMLEKLPNFKRCAMGDIIKITYGKMNGLNYEQIEANKSFYRPDLIELGNWGRKQDPDYWLKKILKLGDNIIVTDVRMMHEYEVFKNAGAVAVRVEASRQTRANRGILVSEDDITETELDNIDNWDFVINNDFDYECLESQVNEFIKKFFNA